MVVDDVQFLNILKGKRVKLTLKNSSYLGVIQRINSNKTLILGDVFSSSNGFKCRGSKMFSGHEIINVEFTDEAHNDKATGNIPHFRLEEHLNVEKFQPYRKTITFGDDDEDEEEYINFEVIDEFHEKFGAAVMHIKRQRVVSVGADGVEVFKHGRLCWLQIGTKTKVYLFDILLLGTRAFKNGLSMLLESKHILKVIHDCRAIAGCLIAQFGVKLTNVFDTQVADVMCFHSETGGFLPDRVSTLQEVVSLHLKVPSSQLVSLQMKSQLTKEEREMWYKRPCPVPLLKVMALSVIHLQPLRLVLLDSLMTDYMFLVDSYLCSSYYQPDELEQVTMESVLELPKELRQLEQMRCERQETAAEQYPVTEQGLLARFKPRAPPKASPQNKEDVVRASPQPARQTPSRAAGADLRRQTADTVGRGRPLEQSPVPAIPALGRGFLLQMSQAQIQEREGPGDSQSPSRVGTTTPSRSSPVRDQEVMPGPDANEQPKEAAGLRGDPVAQAPEPVSSSLRQSFRSFRF